MMKLLRIFVLILISIAIFVSCSNNPRNYKKVTIGELIDYSSKYDSSLVEISGIVTLTLLIDSVPGYVIKDTTGSIIVLSNKGFPPKGYFETHGKFISKYRLAEGIYKKVLLESKDIVHPEVCQ